MRWNIGGVLVMAGLMMVGGAVYAAESANPSSRAAVSDTTQKTYDNGSSPTLGDQGGYHADPAQRTPQEQRNWQNDTRPGGGADTFGRQLQNDQRNYERQLRQERQNLYNQGYR